MPLMALASYAQRRSDRWVRDDRGQGGLRMVWRSDATDSGRVADRPKCRVRCRVTHHAPYEARTLRRPLILLPELALGDGGTHADPLNHRRRCLAGADCCRCGPQALA